MLLADSDTVSPYESLTWMIPIRSRKELIKNWILEKEKPKSINLMIGTSDYLYITQDQGIKGATIPLNLSNGGSLTVKIPPNTVTEKEIVIRGEGEQSYIPILKGDYIIRVKIRP